jgi:2-polyprenyl-3-methyl-5-hydroxy-6-metoxy-1,4-benzoquinol methylase
MTVTVEEDLEAAVGEFAGRIAGAAIGALELLTIELGHRLGLYSALADGPATPVELAKRSGIDSRYVREWLEQQATSGIVTVEAEPVDGIDPDARVFSLPIAAHACLLDPEGLAYMVPLTKLVADAPASLDKVVHAYRTGGGVSFGEYGDGIRHFQAAANRPQFVNLLASAWLPTMPDVMAKLERGARVADIGCGSGWSSIAFARAFPKTTVDGFDLDAASIDDARELAAAEGCSDRVRFEVRNAADAPDGEYVLVCCFEALHDMARPVEVLRAMKSTLAADGAVFIVDQRAEPFMPDNPDPIQHLLYAASVMHCLPVGRSEEPSACTGTVMQASTLERYATEAGFRSVEVLPVEHDMFRFYRLRP